MELHAVRTWFDKNHGMVSVDDHVTNVIRDIREISDGRVRVYYNTQSGGYDLVETCDDHTDRLVFSTDALDQRCVERLRAADHWLGGNSEHQVPDEEDFVSRLDAENEEIRKNLEQENWGRVGDAAERIAWAMEFDGRGTQASISVAKDLDGRKSHPGSS